MSSFSTLTASAVPFRTGSDALAVQVVLLSTSGQTNTAPIADSTYACCGREGQKVIAATLRLVKPDMAVQDGGVASAFVQRSTRPSPVPTRSTPEPARVSTPMQTGSTL